MSKPLSSLNEREKMLAISRRLKQGLVDKDNRGLGFWSAYAAIRHIPAASLTLEVRGTYLDIEKELNKVEGKKMRSLKVRAPAMSKAQGRSVYYEELKWPYKRSRSKRLKIKSMIRRSLTAWSKK